MSDNLRVFISYSWDDDEHRAWVRRLATRLREDGIEARLDDWHRRNVTIPEFMNREVRRADKILVVCTPTYQEKVYAMEDGAGITGSGWEAMLLSSAMFVAGLRGKVVPVLARGTWTDAAPLFLQGIPYADLSDYDLSSAMDADDGPYNRLLRALREGEGEAPPIGTPHKAGDQPRRRAPHNLPYFPHGFVGRAAELEELALLMDRRIEANSDEPPWVAISGMPGIGKTQVALRYTWCERDRFETVCWVDASSRQIEASFAALSDRPLALNLPRDLPIADRIQAVSERLERGGPHLLILDNVDRPESFVGFIPAGAQVRVLATSRREDLPGFEFVRLERMPEADAMALLLGDHDWAADEEDAARDLAEAFGWLTLPLSVAGKILRRPSQWPSKLLARVQRRGGALGWSAGLSEDQISGKSADLGACFQTSLEILDQDDPIDGLARRIFLAGGWLAPTAIPPLLFREMTVPVDGREPDFDMLEDAVARLVDIGLATMDLTSALTIHRLVGEFARQTGGSEAQGEALDALAQEAAGLPPNAFTVPVPGLGGLGLSELQPHLNAVLPLLAPGMPLIRGWIPMRLAESLEAGGQGLEAAEILESAVSSAPNDTWAARYQGMRGRLLADNEKFEEALPPLRDTFPMLQKCLEPCHTETLLAGVALAETFSKLNRLADARSVIEPLASTCGDLKAPVPGGALVHKAAAQISQAEGRLEDALVQLLYAMAAEPAGPAIGYQIQEPAGNAFAELFANTVLSGNDDLAGQILKRAEEILGRGPNADITRAQHEAGMLLTESGEPERGLPYLKAALIGAQQLEPPNQGNVGATLFVIGEALMELGDYEGAVSQFETALAIAEGFFEEGDFRIERTRQALEAARAGQDRNRPLDD